RTTTRGHMAQTNKHRESTWREQGSTRTRQGNKHVTTQGRQTQKLNTDRTQTLQYHSPETDSPVTSCTTDRQTDRQTETERDTDRDRQRQTETDRDRDRQRERERERQAGRQRERQ